MMYQQDLVVNYCPDPPRRRELPLPMDPKWSESFEARSSLLLPENEGRELTLTKSVFQSSKLSHWWFTLGVTFPSTPLVGDHYHVVAQTQLSEIELSSISVGLKG